MKNRPILFTLFAIAMSVAALGAHAAKADTVISTIYLPEYQMSNGVKVAQYYYQVTYTFNLDQSNYAPGAQLTAMTTVTGATCSNGASGRTIGDIISATVNGTKKSLIDAGIATLTAAQASFATPTTPGNYGAAFSAQGLANYDGVTIDGTPINDTIPYTVNGSTPPPSPPPVSPPTTPSSTGGGSTTTPPPPPTAPAAQPPICTFTSNPSHIVVPESSYLSYSCQNVTACDLSGGQFGVYPGVAVTVDPTAHTASSTQAVNPPMDTTYELDCSDTGSGVSYSNELQTDVIVDSPSLIEIAPH